MDRISNRKTTWYLINVKARNNQSISHYVDVFHRLLENDPLVDLPREKCESLKNIIFTAHPQDLSGEPKEKESFFVGCPVKYTGYSGLNIINESYQYSLFLYIIQSKGKEITL